MSAATLAMDALLLLGLAYAIGYAVWEYLATRAWVECCECGRRYDGTGLYCPACNRATEPLIAELLAKHAAEMERGL